MTLENHDIILHGSYIECFGRIKMKPGTSQLLERVEEYYLRRDELGIVGAKLMNGEYRKRQANSGYELSTEIIKGN